MAVEIVAIGGWGEVGRNMTAVRIDDKVILFDMGLHLPNYIKLNDEEREAWVKFTEGALKRADAVPQDGTIKDWRQDVVAIVITHAHLDHVGAVPYLAAKYHAPIICTPFTASVLRTIYRDEKLDLQNKIIQLKPGQKTTLQGDIKLEFLHITHSAPQTIIAALHTPDGAIVYGNDYKLDKHPALGKPYNPETFRKLGEKGVLALIQDCLYAGSHKKTPSERVAKEMLREVLMDVDSEGKGLILTTFASHTGRLKTIAEFGKKLNRKVMFMGRSIAKYCYAAKEAGIVDLSKQAKIFKYRRQIARKLKDIYRRKDKYLLVVSGHQGEPQSALSRMIDGGLPWKWSANDHVIFSSIVIPAEINRKQREIMETKLKAMKVRMFKDIHVSGHSSREDLREMIQLLQPQHVFPTHGEKNMTSEFNTLAQELRYKLGENLHPLINGERKLL